jgi:dUTP pyrophosphatase
LSRYKRKAKGEDLVDKVNIKILKLEHFDEALQLPTYQSEQAAGADLCACFGTGESLKIEPGERKLVSTGLSFEIPEGYEVQIRPRSGLSFKTNLFVVNSPGTIDSDYRGEIKIIIGNWGREDEIIKHGERIAQMVVSPVTQAKFEITSELAQTARGSGGFGSTGRS